jgi:ATP-binding cassette subfamily F protein uup
MDKLVDHLFVFEGDGVIRDFNGTYSEYREDLDERSQVRKKSEAPARQLSQESKTDVPAARKKMSFKEKTEFESLGKEIEQLEAEKAEIMERLNRGGADHQQLQEWSVRLEHVIAGIDEKSLRWLELSELAG